jgi:hypothetical protein
MAGLFDNFFSGGGAAAGNMFGGNMYGDLLTPEQLAAVRRQSMMQVAAKLLESSGPSTTRRTLGQTLGGALSAGAEAMQSGQTNAVQQMLLKQKLDEAKDARAASERVRGLFTPPETQAVGAPLSPEQALLAGGAGRVGPTPQRQGLMTLGAGMPTTGMPTPPGAGMPTAPSVGMPTAQSAPQAAPMGLREFAASLPLAEQQSLQAMAQTDPNGALKALNERFMTASSFGKPEFFVGQDGKPVAMQYNPFGEGRVVPGLRPSEPTPNEIKILRDLGLPVTLAGVTQLRQAGAARQNVQVGGSKLNLTPAQEAVDKKFADTYLDWQSGGGADTIGNIAQINTVLQQLEQGKALTGPMIGVQPDLLLAITNPQAAGAKEQVQEVVQRNLRVVLGAQFTAKEGDALISRAYNPTLKPEQNAARLRKLFEQMSVAAGQKQAMAEYYEANGTLQGYKGKQPNINDFYKALEVRPAPKAGDVVGGWRFKGGNPNDEANYEKVR